MAQDFKKTPTYPINAASNEKLYYIAQNQILSHDPTSDKPGNLNAKDWYMIGGLTIGYVIKSNCSPIYKVIQIPSSKRLHCPSILKF